MEKFERLHAVKSFYSLKWPIARTKHPLYELLEYVDIPKPIQWQLDLNTLNIEKKKLVHKIQIVDNS